MQLLYYDNDFLFRLKFQFGHGRDKCACQSDGEIDQIERRRLNGLLNSKLVAVHQVCLFR